LEPGDEVMADKGFQIQDLLEPLGEQLNIPPFLNSNHQMSADDILTKNVAHLRKSQRIPYFTELCYLLLCGTQLTK